VDILSFGATKNGCLAAEAIVVFEESLAETLAFRRKRAGHLLSKSRFVAAQLDAYLADGLWLDLAAHANRRAAALADAIAAIPGARLAFPPEANEVFAWLPPETAQRLRDAGAIFYPWVVPGLGPEEEIVRFVTSFRTSEEDVANFAAAAKGA
jgi:threonine aldolase